MSQASKLRNLLRRISETEALLRDLRKQASDPAAGKFLTCRGCQKEHFIAVDHNMPSNWWHDDAPDYEDWGKSYMCSDCFRKEAEELLEQGWKRAGRTRGEKRRAKALAALQRTRAYWQTIVVFQHPVNMRVYRGTRLQMVGSVCACGCQGVPEEIDPGQQTSADEVLVLGWPTTIDPAPDACADDWLLRNDITLDD